MVLKNLIKTKGKSVACGMGIGLVNGLFGGGGGMVAVPTLQCVLHYPVKKSHATAIAVIAPVCLFASVPYLWQGYGNMAIILPCAVGFTAGGFIGAKLLGRLPDFVIQAIFIFSTLSAGIRLLV